MEVRGYRELSCLHNHGQTEEEVNPTSLAQKERKSLGYMVPQDVSSRPPLYLLIG